MSPDTMFRLHHLRLRNYRSIKIYNLSLGPLTLLVGPNGSGESNVLDALRFTSQTPNENLDGALGERDGIAEVRCRSTRHPMHFTIAMTFVMGAGWQAGEYEFEIGAAEGDEHRASRETCRVRSGEFGSEDRFFETHIGQLMSSSKERLPRIFPDRLLLVALSGQRPSGQLFDELASMGVFSLVPEVMQVVQEPDPGDLLRRGTSSIASVTKRPRRIDLPAKIRIEEHLSHIVPGMKAIQHVGVASWEALKFQQEAQGAASPWSFQASSINGRALRALGVLVASFTGTREVMSPVRIEESGSALYPAASGLLLDAIRDANQRRQILVTGHSPDLLDSPSITTDELLAVCSISGTTVVDRPDAATQVALKESLFTAGELVRTDQPQPEIDGVAW